MARSGGFWAGVVFVGAALGAVAATAVFTTQYHPVVHSGLCTVSDDGETYARTTEAANNAALISVRAGAHGLGTNASTVAVATAIQESGLRNLDYGDRDSVGLFQQRPSQGWGTAEQIANPYRATNAFYKALNRVDGWDAMRVTEAAQAVQRSGFPEAYEDHAPEAAAWATAFRGEQPAGAVDCDLEAATEPSTAQDLAKRITADYGKGVYTAIVVAHNANGSLLGVTSNSGEASDLDSLANWAIAVADAESITSVRRGSQQWIREEGVSVNATPPAFDGVLIGVLEAAPAP